MLRCTVKHDVATALTGAWPHVHDAVCCQHHRGIVLDHHQGVACITQAQHGLGDAVHIARMQTYAGFIQHKQGIHQRRAQGGGEVDTLHLSTTQGATLSVQTEVAQAHIAEVFQTRTNFLEQQMQSLLFSLRMGGQ